MSSDSSDDQFEGKYFEGDDSSPVFPHARYISKFYQVSSDKAGLTRLDIDLYNECYLPYNPLNYYGATDEKFKRSVDDDESIDIDADLTESNAPRPTYLIEKPPCRRSAAINANCYYRNTNRTLSGLRPYEDSDNAWDEQQQCFCEKYPYFDSAYGCNECFRLHGGIEGYHWFPQSFLSAISSSYCNADPVSTGFYPFVSEWKESNSAAVVPSQATPAPDVLGTETAASLYYTYAAATSAVAPNGARRHSIGQTSALFTFIFMISISVLSNV